VAERKTRVPIQGTNQMVEGFDVPVEESNERWSEFKLEDGTVLKVKMTVVSAVRVEGQFDPQGNPTYVMNMTPVIAVVDVPERLRKKVQ
jgi:hypothetical protein